MTKSYEILADTGTTVYFSSDYEVKSSEIKGILIDDNGISPIVKYKVILKYHETEVGTNYIWLDENRIFLNESEVDLVW